MKFTVTQYIQGKPLITNSPHKNVESVRVMMEKQFWSDNQVFSVEETNYENGKIEFTLKDKNHKVILQIKQQ
jgi:pectin methylesterase-like acyl-CoA thioesterase